MDIILAYVTILIIGGLFASYVILNGIIKYLSKESFFTIIPISFIVFFLEMLYLAFTKVPITMNTIISSIIIAIFIFLAINYRFILKNPIKFIT